MQGSGSANLVRSLGVILFSLLLLSSSVYGLPWDQDLFSQQSYKANEIARAPMPGTVPLGYTPYSDDNFELADTLKNPVKPELKSIWNGQRLWNSNCAVCHGESGKAGMHVSEWLPVPNILQDVYSNKSDGWVFAVIKNGQGVMPRYGYKFSDKEHWDLVNYVRFLQKKVSVPEMKIPEDK